MAVSLTLQRMDLTLRSSGWAQRVVAVARVVQEPAAVAAAGLEVRYFCRPHWLIFKAGSRCVVGSREPVVLCLAAADLAAWVAMAVRKAGVVEPAVQAAPVVLAEMVP